MKLNIKVKNVSLQQKKIELFKWIKIKKYQSQIKNRQYGKSQ